MNDDILIENLLACARDCIREKAQKNLRDFFYGLEKRAGLPVKQLEIIRAYSYKEIYHYKNSDLSRFCSDIKNYVKTIKAFADNFIKSGFYYLIDIPSI